MSRRTLIGLALLAGLLGTAEAAPARRIKVSFRACDVAANCTQKIGDGRTTQQLYNEEPTIELVTMGIGSLMWERHGHIALCVRYHDSKNDICYNYGIGNFHQPGAMAWGFFRGAKSFWAGEQEVDDLIRIYAGADRTVWAQPIPLTAEQKQQVIKKLEHDILDEHRYYAYDHFWDNCTTRVRDILDDALGGALKSMTEETDGKTFRDLARDGFYGMRIPLLITDMFMGRVTDRVPTYWERMFLPQYLREAVQKKWDIKPIVLYARHAGIDEKQDSNGNGLSDVQEDSNGNGIPDFEEDGEHNTGRFLFALFVLGMTAPAWITRRFGRFQRTGLAFAVVPPVILGFVTWFLAIISPLPYVELNETCLIFFPLDACLLFLPQDKRRMYARGRVVMLGAMALLMVFGVLTQPLFAPLLWPLVPAAVVGFWPDKWTRKKPAPPVEVLANKPVTTPKAKPKQKQTKR